MPTVKVNDTMLHYADEGQGVPVLLVHGFPLDHSMWTGQIEALSRRCRVIAPDLRGFGRSQVTPGVVTMQTYADDLAGLLEQLRVTRPVVLAGFSMGGYVAFQFAERHRDKLAKLILCDTRAVADSPEAAEARESMATRAEAEGAAFIADVMLPKLFAPSTLQAEAPCVQTTRDVIAKASGQGVAAACRGMAQRPDVSDGLGKIDVPTLVLCGSWDAISTPEEMRGIAEKMPNATYTGITGAGHLSPVERPVEVSAAMQTFIG